MSRYGMAAFELKPDLDDAGFDHGQVCDIGIIGKLRRNRLGPLAPDGSRTHDWPAGDDGLSGMIRPRLCPVNKSTHSRAVSLRWSVISFGIVPSPVWMPDVYLGSIEPRMSVVLDRAHWNWIAKNPMSMNRR
jgi:hypothetical protein